MSGDRDYALGELDRRQGNIYRVGVIAAVDAAQGLATVDLGDLVTDWLPWLTPRAGLDRAWSTPDVGEQVAILTPGDPSQGVIIGSLFSNAKPANGDDGKDRRLTFSDGTVVEFDRTASVLNVTLNPAGSANVTVGATEFHLVDGQATVKATAITMDGNVTITGTLTTAGNAIMQSDVAVSGKIDAVGEIKAGTIGLKAHHHTAQGATAPTTAAQA